METGFLTNVRHEGLVREAGAHEVIDRAGDIAEQIRVAAPEGIDVALDVVAGELVSEGLPTREIAARLVLSPRTVEHHVASLLARTGLRSRAELAAFARANRVAPTA